MSVFQLLSSDDPRMAGNWYPFPPPDKGFYNLRRIQQATKPLGFQYYTNRRVYEGGGSRLLCMGRRVTRMTSGDGWQFQFLQQSMGGVPVNWRPMAIVYDTWSFPQPVILEKRDISGQLPFARSIEEARYIVRQIPERWPIFRKIHIEYTEERLQS